MPDTVLRCRYRTFVSLQHRLVRQQQSRNRFAPFSSSYTQGKLFTNIAVTVKVCIFFSRAGHIAFCSCVSTK